MLGPATTVGPPNMRREVTVGDEERGFREAIHTVQITPQGPYHIDGRLFLVRVVYELLRQLHCGAVAAELHDVHRIQQVGQGDLRNPIIAPLRRPALQNCSKFRDARPVAVIQYKFLHSAPLRPSQTSWKSSAITMRCSAVLDLMNDFSALWWLIHRLSAGVCSEKAAPYKLRCASSSRQLSSYVYF